MTASSSPAPGVGMRSTGSPPAPRPPLPPLPRNTPAFLLGRGPGWGCIRQAEQAGLRRQDYGVQGRPPGGSDPRAPLPCRDAHNALCLPVPLASLPPSASHGSEGSRPTTAQSSTEGRLRGAFRAWILLCD